MIQMSYHILDKPADFVFIKILLLLFNSHTCSGILKRTVVWYQIYMQIQYCVLLSILLPVLTIKQDWVAFMSLPYWVEVMVAVELRLRLI